MKREILESRYPNEEIVFLDGYDEAILGVTRDDNILRVIYSEARLVSILSNHMEYIFQWSIMISICQVLI